MSKETQEGIKRAYCLALVSTEREDFSEWKIQHVYGDSGVVRTTDLTPEQFMRGFLRRAQKGGAFKPLNQSTANIMDCFCLRCGHAWRRRRQNKRPDECPECKSRTWDVPAYLLGDRKGRKRKKRGA